MLDTQIEQFLRENEWVDGAHVSDIDKKAQSCRIQIDVSQSGHRLIRDRGMKEFERRIQSHQVSLEFNEICWDICPFTSDVSLKGVAQPTAEFPPILSVFENSRQRRLLMHISPQLAYFRGHFPGNPVLPGIVQLHWAVNVSLEYFSFRVVPVEIKRLKFKSVIVPPKMLELTVCRFGQNEVQFEYASLCQQHSEGRLIFDED